MDTKNVDYEKMLELQNAVIEESDVKDYSYDDFKELFEDIDGGEIFTYPVGKVELTDQ